MSLICDIHIYKNVKWLFPRLVYLQTQNLLSHYIRLLERDWNITINNIVNSYFFLFCFCFLFEFFAKKNKLIFNVKPCCRLCGNTPEFSKSETHWECLTPFSTTPTLHLKTCKSSRYKITKTNIATWYHANSNYKTFIIP